MKYVDFASNILLVTFLRALQRVGGLEVDKEGKEPLSVCTFILPAVIIREGNGTPLQYSCLEDPMDRRAW